MEMHVFIARKFEGSPEETEEMRPQWFAVADIPFPQMWADDLFWMPQVLGGNHVAGWFEFDGEATVAAHRLEVVSADALLNLQRRHSPSVVRGADQCGASGETKNGGLECRTSECTSES
eukprot:RCo027641